MGLNSRTYRGSLSAVTATQLIVTIDDLDTLMNDNSSAILDIYSWASFTSMPENIREFSSYNYKQLLIKKASGTITIENSNTIQSNETYTGALDLVWSESVSGSDIELYADITGLNANVFRRAYLKMIKA